MSNLSELDKSIKELEGQTNILSNNNKVLSKIGEIKSDLEKSVILVEKNNDGFKEIVSHLNAEVESFTNEISLLQKANQSFVDDLTSTNKKLIRELEDALVSKLDRLNSDVQNAIRGEVQQLEKSVKNDLTEKFNQLSESFKIQLKEQEIRNKELIENQNKSLKMLIFVTIGLIIIGILIAAIK
jgi:hypothetical protein